MAAHWSSMWYLSPSAGYNSSEVVKRECFEYMLGFNVLQFLQVPLVLCWVSRWQFYLWNSFHIALYNCRGTNTQLHDLAVGVYPSSYLNFRLSVNWDVLVDGCLWCLVVIKFTALNTYNNHWYLQCPKTRSLCWQCYKNLGLRMMPS